MRFRTQRKLSGLKVLIWNLPHCLPSKLVECFKSQHFGVLLKIFFVSSTFRNRWTRLSPGPLLVASFVRRNCHPTEQLARLLINTLRSAICVWGLNIEIPRHSVANRVCSAGCQQCWHYCKQVKLLSPIGFRRESPEIKWFWFLAKIGRFSELFG